MLAAASAIGSVFISRGSETGTVGVTTGMGAAAAVAGVATVAAEGVVAAGVAVVAAAIEQTVAAAATGVG